MTLIEQSETLSSTEPMVPLEGAALLQHIGSVIAETGAFTISPDTHAKHPENALALEVEGILDRLGSYKGEVTCSFAFDEETAALKAVFRHRRDR